LACSTPEIVNSLTLFPAALMNTVAIISIAVSARKKKNK
jgi:hypothetical protein